MWYFNCGNCELTDYCIREYIILLSYCCCIKWYYCPNLQTTFAQYDTDRSGTMEGHELHRAITAFGMGWHYIE